MIMTNGNHYEVLDVGLHDNPTYGLLVAVRNCSNQAFLIGANGLKPENEYPKETKVEVDTSNMWNTICNVCGSPAYLGFDSFTCSQCSNGRK